MAKKRKSSRKSSSKRKRGSLSRAQDKKRRNSDGVNFISFVAGMVSLLLLISLAVAGFRPNDVPDPVVAPQFNTLGDGILGVSDFDKVIEEGNEAQVAELLRTLNNWPRNAALPIKIEFHRKRIALANRLLEMNCSELRRLIAIESKIQASSQYYGLDFLNEMNIPEAYQALESAATDYVDEEDETIRREAKLAMAKLRVFEYAKHKDEARFDSAKASVFDAIDAFPDNTYVIDNVRLLIRRVFADDAENGRELMLQFYDKYGKSDSAQIKELALELNDSLLLADADYQSLISKRWADGEQGRDRLRDATLELIANPSSGETVFKQAGTTLAWFEQIHELESARKICDALIASAQVHSVPKIVQLVQRMGDEGIERLEMVGQPLNFSGKTLDGTLKPHEFESQIVIVVFFSNNDRSLQALTRLLSLEGELAPKGISLLAVCSDHQLSEPFEKLLERYPHTPCVISEGEESPSNALLEQYPAFSTPHVVLVDHHGIIKRINVQLADIRTHIDELVSIRRQEERNANE